MKFSYEDLEVAKLARKLIKEIYLLTKNFPKEELYGLTSQIRRAATSVLLNIAEGSTGKTKKDFNKFVRTAISSLAEVHCCVKISIELNYIEEKDYTFVEPVIQELYFKLIKLSKYLIKDNN